jgi:hypothetical protein
LNKRTIAVKDALETAFDELGGIDGLVQWARRDPGEFYRQWSKMLPKDINVNATVTLGELLDALKKPEKPVPGAGE